MYPQYVGGQILIEAFCNVVWQIHKSLELCQVLLIEIEYASSEHTHIHIMPLHLFLSKRKHLKPL